MPLVTSTIFVAVMGIALISDVRANRIPNVLIGAGLVIGLTLQAVSGPGALGNAVLGAGLALILAFPLFALGALGGGDAKLFMVVGAFMGPAGFLQALLASALVGGLLGLAVAARRGVIVAVLLGCRDLIIHAVTFGRNGSRPKLGDPGAITIPYGAAIAVGSVAAWFLVPAGA